MRNIIFVNLFDKEGKYYHSYKEEFWALVELSGFSTCGLDKIDYDSDNIYIHFLRNGNTDAAFKNKKHKCKLVLWLQEWGKWAESGILNEGFDLEPYWDEVWVSDRYFRRLLIEKNFSMWRARASEKIKYVFFGGHLNFGGNPEEPKLWDFVHLSYVYGTRAHKMQILMQNGYTIAPASYECNACSPLKSETLARSRWGLSLQQFNTPFINHQRWTLFASWGLPILCDYTVDPYPYKVFPEGLIHFNPRETVCANKEEMNKAAEYNYHLVTTRTFKQSVEDAVKGVKIK